MSELKDYDIMDIEAMDDERLEKSESGKIQATRVYIKEDVDKVIAELKDIDSKNRSAYYKDLAMMAKDVDRHKYKRCLAMANYCHDNAMWLEENGITKSSMFMLKWEKRWLELAEKFKEAK